MSTNRNATPNLRQFEPGLVHRIAAVKKLAGSLLSVVNEMHDLPAVNVGSGINLHNEILRYEIELISKALQLTGNHQIRAAKILNINPTTLNAKIKRYKIRPQPSGDATAPEQAAY